MKKKIDVRIPIIIILIIILIIMCYLYFKDENTNKNALTNIEFNFSDIEQKDNDNSSNNTIVSTTAEIQACLSEKIELHATYYLEENYVEANQIVKAGDNILKYTNDTYMTAPYDLVVTEINIPEKSEKCTNDHYIGISSINNLKVQLKVDETKIESINLGQEATIKVEAYEDKAIQGYVTNISSIASNGKFTVTVEFENDGDILIGMTSTVTLKK